MNLAVFLIGIYVLLMSLWAETSDASIDFFIVRLIPFWSGLYLMWYGANAMGWV